MKAGYSVAKQDQAARQYSYGLTNILVLQLKCTWALRPGGIVANLISTVRTAAAIWEASDPQCSNRYLWMHLIPDAVTDIHGLI